MQDVHPHPKRHPMTTRTLRRPEWVALLAATLVATLIATMFAFTPTAHATDGSQLEETQIAAVEGDNENSPTRPADEAIEAVDDGLLLRGPAPTPLPESTPDPEAHNNEAPGTETNPAVPEQHNETDSRPDQQEGTAQPKETAPLKETETSDHPEQLTAQSNQSDETSKPDIDPSAATTKAQQSQVACLQVSPVPVGPNGEALAETKVELTANCGIETVFERRISVIEHGTPTVIYSASGPWSGSFTATHHLLPPGRAPATLEYDLYCSNLPNPPRTAYASVPVSEASFRTEVTYPNGAPVTDLTVRARDINTGFEIELDSWSDGLYQSYVFPGTYLVEYYNPDGSLRTLRSANVVGYDDKVRVDVTLSFPPPGTVSGTVTWADGSPVIDQQVFIAGTPTLEDPFPAKITRTDDNGVYEFPEIPAGEYTLQVLHDSHGFVASAPVTVEVGGDHVVDMELDLSAPGAVQGHATFSDGTPVVSDGSGTGNVELIGPVHRFVHTDDNGAFTFDGLPHATYEARVTGAYSLDIGDIDYTSDLIEIDVIPAVTTNQDVVIAMPQGSVKGGVFSDLDYVTPIPDVVVSIPALNVADDTTATNGSFHIDGVEGAN